MKKITFNDAVKIIGRGDKMAKSNFVDDGLCFARVIHHDDGLHIRIATYTNKFENIGGVAFDENDSFYLKSDRCIKAKSFDDGEALIFI